MNWTEVADGASVRVSQMTVYDIVEAPSKAWVHVSTSTCGEARAPLADKGFFLFSFFEAPSACRVSGRKDIRYRVHLPVRARRALGVAQDQGHQRFCGHRCLRCPVWVAG